MKKQLNVRVSENTIEKIKFIQNNFLFYPKKKKINEIVEIAISKLYSTLQGK